MISILASYPGFDSQHLTKKFRGKIVDIAEVNQWCCLEEREQWLEIVDWAHLVLDCGKLVLQKLFCWSGTNFLAVVEKSFCFPDKSQISEISNFYYFFRSKVAGFSLSDLFLSFLSIDDFSGSHKNPKPILWSTSQRASDRWWLAPTKHQKQFLWQICSFFLILRFVSLFCTKLQSLTVNYSWKVWSVASLRGTCLRTFCWKDWKKIKSLPGFEPMTSSLPCLSSSAQSLRLYFVASQT